MADTNALATNIAEDLYDWMYGLKSKDGSFVVDSHEFLPANVTCDFAGKSLFIRGMAGRINTVLSQQCSKWEE